MPQVYPIVVTLTGWDEKNKITGLQVISFHPQSPAGLLPGSTGQLNTEYILVNTLYEAGTVYAAPIIAAHAMRRPPPSGRFCPQLIFNFTALQGRRAGLRSTPHILYDLFLATTHRKESRQASRH